MATLGPLLSVLLFLAAIIAAFWYLRTEEIDREVESVKRDAELVQQQIRLRLIDHLIAFKQSVGFHDTLKLHGVRVADIPFLSRHAMEDPCILTNPRASSMRDVEVVYAEAL